MPDLADLLRRLGLRTLGDVRRAAAAGRAGPVRLRTVPARTGSPAGWTTARSPPGRPPPELAVQAELDPPVERVDTAAFAARALAERAARAAGPARPGRAPGWRSRRRPSTASSCTGCGGTRACSTAAAIADRVRWQLDGWLSGSARALPRAVAPRPGTRPAAPAVIGAGVDPTAPSPAAGPRGGPGATPPERPTAGHRPAAAGPRRGHAVRRDAARPLGRDGRGRRAGRPGAGPGAGHARPGPGAHRGARRRPRPRRPGPAGAVGRRAGPDRPAEPPWPGRLPAPVPGHRAARAGPGRGERRRRARRSG